MPYNKFAYEMIAGKGSTEDSGAVQYILRDNADANELVIATSQIFQGTSLKCAQCHDHPYEQWTQDDFKQMAEFFRDTKIVRYDQQGRPQVQARLLQSRGSKEEHLQQMQQGKQAQRHVGRQWQGRHDRRHDRR